MYKVAELVLSIVIFFFDLAKEKKIHTKPYILCSLLLVAISIWSISYTNLSKVVLDQFTYRTKERIASTIPVSIDQYNIRNSILYSILNRQGYASICGNNGFFDIARIEFIKNDSGNSYKDTYYLQLQHIIGYPRDAKGRNISEYPIDILNQHDIMNNHNLIYTKKYALDLKSTTLLKDVPEGVVKTLTYDTITEENLDPLLMLLNNSIFPVEFFAFTPVYHPELNIVIIFAFTKFKTGPLGCKKSELEIFLLEMAAKQRDSFK